MAQNSEKYAKLAFVLMATDNMSSTLEKAANNANGSFSKIEQSMAKIGQFGLRQGTHFAMMGKQITSSMFNIVKEAANYGDSSTKTARAVGMQVEEWQKLAYAADFAGVSSEELQSSMNKFNKVINAAAFGSKKELQIFEGLGVSLKDAAGNLRPQQEIFKDFSDIFASVEDDANKAAVEMLLFGKSGGKLATLLNSGKQSIEEMGDEAERLGLVFDGKKWEDLNDSMNRVKKAFLGGKLQIANSLLPFVEALTNKINKIVEAVTKWASEHQGLTKIIAIAVSGIGVAMLAVGGLGMAIGGLMYSFLNIKKAFGVVSKLFTASPVILIAIAIAAAAYIIYKNWDKISAFFIKLWETVKQAFSAAWDWIKNMFLNYTVPGLIIKHWDKISAFFIKLWETVKQAFSTAWDWIKNMFLNYTVPGLIIKHWDKISAFFIKLWKTVKQAFSAAWDWIKNMFLNYTPYGLIIKHWDKISAFFKEVWDKVKQAFSAAWDWIKDMFLNYTPVGLVIKHWDAIKDWFAELWEKVKNVFVEKWEAIGEFFSGLKTRFFEWGKNLLQGLIDGVTELINKPVELIQEVGNKMKNGFKSVLGISSPSRLFAEYGTHITKGLTGGIHRGLPAVASSAGSMAMQALTGYGKSFQINKITDGVAELWDKVKNVFVEKWAAISEFFNGLKTRFFEWGKNLLQGLIDGVTELINKPVELIEEIGNKVKNGFKSVLGISSPSRLFMEYGINITKGLTGGINFGLPAIANSSGNMAMQTVSNYGKSFQANMERITPLFHSEKSEPVYAQLQRSFEPSNPESNIIPASQIFNNSTYANSNTGGSPISYAPVINIYGNPASEETKQDFSRMLRENYKEFEYMLKRYFDNKERLSFNS